MLHYISIFTRRNTKMKKPILRSRLPKSIYFLATLLFASFVIAPNALAAVNIVEYTLPTANSVPYGIAKGPDGNMWFTENNINNIAKITPSGTVTAYAIPTAGSSPHGIAQGPDGNMWFAENNVNNISKITPTGRCRSAHYSRPVRYTR